MLLVRSGLVPAALVPACSPCPAVPWLTQLMQARESREGNEQEGTGNLETVLTQTLRKMPCKGSIYIIPEKTAKCSSLSWVSVTGHPILVGLRFSCSRSCPYSGESLRDVSVHLAWPRVSYHVLVPRTKRSHGNVAVNRAAEARHPGPQVTARVQ